MDVSTPAAHAFDELERAVRHLGDELAFFRRRALDAERRVKDMVGHAAFATGGTAASPSDPAHAAAVAALVQARIAALEAENADLRDRLREAAERTRALADRVRFVRQQVPADDEEGT